MLLEIRKNVCASIGNNPSRAIFPLAQWDIANPPPSCWTSSGPDIGIASISTRRAIRNDEGERFNLVDTRPACYPAQMPDNKKIPVEITLEQLASQLAFGQPIAGLDLGSKTIGIAISDAGRMIATPVKTIRRTKFQADATELLTLCAERNVAALVFGLPLNMNGTEGPRVQATRAFARNLRKLTDLPIVYWDERLSTMAVTRTLLEADTSRKRRSEVVDKLAAGYILQGALDRLGRV